MSNLEIREFSQAIINFVNQSTLPIEVKRLALKDILAQVEEETTKVLTEEIRYREEAQREADETEKEEGEVEENGN